MQSTNPKGILITLHLVRAGLAGGLLTKDEVINWADRIITKDEQPNIFFIDLALSSSKSKNDVIHYISEYLSFESAYVKGRPLLGLLYKQYDSRLIDLEQTITTLYRLKSEAIFSDIEESFIYSIDNDFDLAKDNVYGLIEDVRTKTDYFLKLYKDYSIENFDQWVNLDKHVDQALETEIGQYQQNDTQQDANDKDKKPWWQFW